MIDVIELSAALLKFNTINPPGNELECVTLLEKILSNHGLQTEFHPFAPHRANLTAHIGGNLAPLCFTGHVDTVPLGLAPWTTDPFQGEVIDGKMFGRGTSDMKCGVAAFVAAVCNMSDAVKKAERGVSLIITAGEEVGCEGASQLANAGLLNPVSALVVAEPSSNHILVGHKGALWLRAITKGVTAHGSMPHLGVNAAFRAAKAITKLERFEFNCAPHPHLGHPTLNVGTVSSGININSVPDRADIGIDVRSIPALKHSQIIENLKGELGGDIEIETIVDLPAVWTDPNNEFVQTAMRIGAYENPGVRTAPYFTDASVLKPALGEPPTIVLGPGEPSQAHATDEFCFVDKIRQAEEIYGRLIGAYCGA